ncbi:MAG: mannose-1-phosphate guanylyltransferase [Bacteroidota bacterium]|nr:mannose-1-phosphate guanylyltransferase [Bacteroidota bacterium]
MNKNNYAVIMAGGVGSRFWPMSRSDFPKQFIDILGLGKTLIQQTFSRLSFICPQENIFIATNKKYKSLCLEQLPEINSNNILCEPIMRNTAPCIAYACFKIHHQNPNANILIAPSDHLITDEIEFQRIITNCLKETMTQDILLTVGIKPSKPETGYGYIQFEDSPLDKDIRKVKTFTEKPNQDLALQFLDSGDFLWNSGMFIWNSESIIKAYRKHLFDMYEIFSECNQYYNTKEESRFIEQIFGGCKNISVDYGIMEKSENVFVYPADFGWSDLGTWGSVYAHLNKNKNKNAITGSNVLTYDCFENIINVPDNKTVVLQGLRGYIIVECNNTLLICKKEDEQQIKQFSVDAKKH